MNIVLTGFMGTGKTTVGKRLAKRLGWTFVDVDQLIESSAKMPIGRIFAERSEAVFRRLERRQISKIVRSHGQVIATGGGAFLDPQNRAQLSSSGPVVCLAAKPAAIMARIGKRLHIRPLLAGAKDPLARITTLLKQRADAYAQADLTIDTTRLSVDEVIERLVEKLSPCLCKSWQYLISHGTMLSQRYGGKYVVVVGDRVVGSGATQLEAFQSAKHLAHNADAGIYYIPIGESAGALR